MFGTRQQCTIKPNRLCQVSEKPSDATAHSAIMALGSIGIINSYTVFSRLRKNLPHEQRLDLVNKQLQQQYRSQKAD